MACSPFPNNTYICLCTHDSFPPSANGTCRRNVVTVGPGVDGRIPVMPPRNTSLDSQKKEAAEISIDYARINFMVPSIFVGIISFVLLASIIAYCRRKSRRNAAQASPINLKQSLLVAERYAPNPQYSTCSAAGVPVLRKETLSFLKEVGEGCFGKVFKGELLSDDGEQVRIVAIKVLKDTANREAEEDFLREVEIMSAFRHPNILSLLGVVLKDENVNPMMVFEFMPLGDLAELLRNQRRLYPSTPASEDPSLPPNTTQLNRRDLLAIAIQIAAGMRYLASQRFVHRDLACRNCLVADGPVVKIADFGMSRDVYTCDYYKIGGSRLLPVRWMSPESVVYGRFTLESDIWSYGVVLWEIYSYGKQPYYGHTNEEVVKLILDGIMLMPPEDCPMVICDLMRNCWKTEPRHRITFTSICEKLEMAYECEKTEFDVEDENKKSKNTGTRSLPRPPPFPILNDADLLDGQGYLKPIEVKDPVPYLEPVCD
ncbi:unnamed protein product [Acanthoscelides obtectus]|uniref:Protein kinase domain-containing protein n=2 Tax=Acanthoscelides obtectus TaxID=200917 RepID=A0A9P0LBM1_ACAOB|nr:unnamed protein product [Acanthoscelides obtectus]CAK1629587.1 Tyrosine-protein kinase transmembrane receptor Ror [Acanthoscelides obtectus]